MYTRKGRATPGKLNPAATHCLLIATHLIDPRKDDKLWQARECHWELNPGRWRQRRVRLTLLIYVYIAVIVLTRT